MRTVLTTIIAAVMTTGLLGGAWRRRDPAGSERRLHMFLLSGRLLLRVGLLG